MWSEDGYWNKAHENGRINRQRFTTHVNYIPRLTSEAYCKAFFVQGENFTYQCRIMMLGCNRSKHVGQAASLYPPRPKIIASRVENDSNIIICLKTSPRRRCMSNAFEHFAEMASASASRSSEQNGESPLNPAAAEFTMPAQTTAASNGVPSASAPAPTMNGTSRAQKRKDAPEKNTQTEASNAAESGEKKLSGAELKKQKAAEKAARRQEKLTERVEAAPVAQTQAQTPTQPQAPQLQRRPSAGKKDNAPVTHHKRTGSSAGKALPIRGASTNVPPEPEKKLREDKRVLFFSHLYSREKRTSIAGASKELHPAVLALGLQLRDHVICGGNARCVATLLVFKKVS